MPSSSMTYVLTNILQEIPLEILNLAFQPQKFNTTLEQRIISEIIEGPILLDTNLVGGKRRDIILKSSWALPVSPDSNWASLNATMQGVFYKVPPEARDNRNISSVIGITSNMATSAYGAGLSQNGSGSYGNTASALTSQMLNSRTLAGSPPDPEATLEGTNVIRIFPKIVVTDHTVSVMLEYDSEFINLETSAIFALVELCLCATKRYIATTLRVTVDETEIVAGMEIGIIKTLIEEYNSDGKLYREKLMNFKGASHYDKRSLGRLIYHAI